METASVKAASANVAELVRRQARERPDALAIICRECRLTYQQLDRRASQVANGLRRGGAAAGARIAYLGRNSASYFEVLLGSAKARCALVPLNWRLAAPEIHFILRDARPDLVFADPEFLPALASASARPRTLVTGDAGGTDDYGTWRSQQTDADPLLPASADDVALIMYTSGTTGLPKGAQLSHRNLMSHLHFVGTGAFGTWTPEDLQLICLPTFHIGGTDSGLWSFYSGSAVLLLTDANTATIVEAFARHRVTVAGFVPTIMRAVLADPATPSLDFSALRLISYGGSPISPELMEQARRVFDCRLQQLFGMTETTGGVCILTDEDHCNPDRNLLRSCGRPLPGVEIRIVDEKGQERSRGIAGEIAVRGPVVTVGYWQRPQETEAALCDGWFRTGDIGTMDAAGYLYIHDRIKDMIVSGGENVYPTEVENVLALHESVAECAVIGVPDPRWGEAVKAFVVLRVGREATEPELLAFARKRIAGYKCPKSIEFSASLPRNAAGKLLRRELRKPFWGDAGRQVG